MFTGIITDIGKIISIKNNGILIAEIETNYKTKDINIGASIACNGICLTVAKKTNKSFFVDVSQETISRTNISRWKKGSKINLEKSLKLGDEFGGHIVSGHVDGLAEVKNINEISGSYVITFIVPKELAMFIAEKGSIAINGISLTVNEVKNNSFKVNIIPHTWKYTNISTLKKGDKVNIEIDMLARYVKRLLDYKGIKL